MIHRVHTKISTSHPVGVRSARMLPEGVTIGVEVLTAVGEGVREGVSVGN
jgi:hypothetical protein